MPPRQRKPEIPLSVEPDVARNKLASLLESIPQFRGQTASFPAFQAWESDVRIALSKFYGPDSEEFARFKSIWFTPGVGYPGQPDSEYVEALHKGLEQARLFLLSRIEDWPAQRQVPRTVNRPTASTRDVFIVHGHDHGIKETVARFLSKLNLSPIILHEQADEGSTIIEKFEKYADVRFAVAIFSGDDLGVAKRDVSGDVSMKSLRPRGRQNVVFEFGYFVGTLGRKNVVAIVENGVETPSDYAGVLYVPFDAADGWRLRLVKELKAAGFDIDANAVF
jgi:predicted nucleotide-binding protein